MFLDNGISDVVGKERVRGCATHPTLVLKFVPSAGRVCGAATHAVGRGAGYGLLPFIGYNRKKVSAALR